MNMEEASAHAPISIGLRGKIIIAITVITTSALFLFVRQELGEFKKRFRQATEEPLADTVGLLAASLSDQEGDLSKRATLFFNHIQQNVGRYPLLSHIYELSKKGSDLRVYVTSSEGIVLYDSSTPSAKGADYRQWNDVIRALRGEYGARTTREGLFSVLYVAAPIYHNGTIVGAVTLGKSVRTLDLFIRNATYTTITFAILYGAALVIILILLSLWITRPLLMLTAHARKIAHGENPQLPRVPHDEIGIMAHAFEEMRSALEGKKYVERYLQTLSHELKSPLSGIRGALEILEDAELSPFDRQKFLQHISHETERLTQLNEKLLALSHLEAGSRKLDKQLCNVATILNDVVTRYTSQAERKKITFALSGDDTLTFYGDYALISEAFANIIDNALGFSPEESSISIHFEKRDATTVISISDKGPGIPDWAKDKVFDKFFSLPRPHLERKSTGLGLALVREIIELHRGHCTLTKNKDNGVTATITLPSSDSLDIA